MFGRSRFRPSSVVSGARRHPRGRDARGIGEGGRDARPFEQLESRRLFAAGIGLWVDGPGLTPEGDYTLNVFADGDAAANPTEITVNWGDGFQTVDVGAGDYLHSLSTSGSNYEGDAPFTDYTITADAVARHQASVAGTATINDAAVDSQGRRVTVDSGWQVRRYNPDGSLNGQFSVPVVGGVGLAVAVDSSDRILVAGRSGASQFTVARLTDSGALDATFAPGGLDGNGVATTTFGLQSSATAIAIQPDGKIVVGGESGVAGFGDFVVARYLPADGSLDATFDIDGKATRTVGGTSPLHDIAVDASGRVVAVGTLANVGDQAGLVVGFTGAGAADGLYTIDAIPGNEQGTAVALPGDGSILVAEKAGNGQLVLARLTASGAADPSFGSGGSVVHEYEPLGGGVLFDADVRSLVVRDDQTIVAGGMLVNPVISGPHAGRRGLAVFKFDAAGNKALAFDADGVVYTDGGTSLAVSGGHLSLVGESLIQSGTVQDGLGGGADSDGMGVYVETATFCVSVSNVAPSASFAPTDAVGDEDLDIPPSNLGTAAPGAAAWFAFEAADPSWADAAVLTYHIDWGDGSAESFSAGATYDFPDGLLFDFPLYVPHSFEASGNLTVTLTVSDDDGGSSVKTFPVTVAAASGVIDDPAHPGQSVVYVLAPVHTANKIQVNSGTSTTSVVVDGATAFFAAQPVDRVVVYGNTGDDMIQVIGAAAARMEFYGGAGNDRLKGSGNPDVLSGGDGDDMLVGGAERDLLIGGLGADKVIGDSEDDILIGGVYVDAGFREAVGAVMAEWTSANTYEDRVNFIRGGGGANGAYQLIGHDSAEAAGFQNVFDDFAVDKLTGDAGRDWFFANVDGTAIDRITDLTSNEFTDADREFVLAP